VSKDIPKATVERLPRYLRCLEQLSGGQETLSSTQLADLASFSPEQVRKDLSNLGSYGVRGVGYNVEQLRHEIRRALGLTREWSVVVVGAGNLGSALAAYGGFENRGFEITGLYDVDSARIGERVAGIEIRALDRLTDDIEGDGVSIGIITTPAPAAQSVADRLVAAGVRSILNFAPAVISVPSHVDVRQVDLSTELQILTFYLQSNGGR
jgi:redox-sensing transcriptional repressor